MRREWLLLLAGCVDGAASSAGVGSTVEAPRILTVLSDPAEGAPGDMVRLEAIVAGAATVSWSMCSTPRAAVDNTAVSPTCARTAEGPSLGDTLALVTRIPADACRSFGSETPAGTMPNAPDATGGYYQPVRVALGAELTVARLRIQCQLAAAPIDVVREFNTRYVRNVAPVILESAYLDGTLRVELTPPESYLRYDATRGRLETALEQQTVSWFVSAGEVVPQLSDVHGTVAEAVWTAPSDAEDAQLWIIARDDRGATTALSRTLQF
jgi:hypothetical protein